MANLRLLVKRRKAVRNIRKITKTMELIATARFKKALDRATEAEAYTKKIAELAADLSASAGEVSHPLLEVRPKINKALLLVCTSNRGLCGGYNGGILREAQIKIRQLRADNVPFDLEVSGRRGATFFKFQGIPITAAVPAVRRQAGSFEQVDEVAQKYIDLYVGGKVDAVYVLLPEVHHGLAPNAGRRVAVAAVQRTDRDDGRRPARRTTTSSCRTPARF